jgi:hypothetical protein
MREPALSTTADSECLNCDRRACGMDDFVAKTVAETTLRFALDRWAPRPEPQV